MPQDGTTRIFGRKEWTLFSCPQRSQTIEFGAVVHAFFPSLEAASNLIQRGLTDFGAVAHAVIMIANISRIDNRDSFLFYREGLSARTVCLLEEMEAEFRAVGSAFGAEIIPMKELLNRYYGCQTESLFTAMTTVPSYRTLPAPDTLDHRFFQEDVACTLVPLYELARKARVATPMLDAVISIASIIGHEDFRSSGRTLDKLGWSDLSRAEIVRWLQQ